MTDTFALWASKLIAAVALVAGLAIMLLVWTGAIFVVLMAVGYAATLFRGVLG